MNSTSHCHVLQCLLLCQPWPATFLSIDHRFKTHFCSIEYGILYLHCLSLSVFYSHSFNFVVVAIFQTHTHQIPRTFSQISFPFSTHFCNTTICFIVYAKSGVFIYANYIALMSCHCSDECFFCLVCECDVMMINEADPPISAETLYLYSYYKQAKYSVEPETTTTTTSIQRQWSRHFSISDRHPANTVVATAVNNTISNSNQ